MNEKSKHKRFLLTVLSILMLLCLAYYLMFLYQLGSHVKAEWWIKNVYHYKESLASEINDRKIIIASGSNALFGIDSPIIEQKTGISTLNMAVHGMLGLDFLYYKINNLVKEGDIVVMPLEFAMYTESGYSDWQVNNFMAWGWDDYLSRLPLVEHIQLLLAVPKSRLIEGVLAQDGSNPLLDKATVIREVNDSISKGGAGLQRYSHLMLNRRGEFIVDEPPTSGLMKKYGKGIAYIAREDAPTDKFMKAYQKLERLIKEKNARLLLTWPVTIRNSAYDLSRPEFQKLTSAFAEKLRARGLEIQCNPALFNLDISFFFNTMDHPNKRGAKIRSINLGGCLNDILNNNDDRESSYADAVRKVRQQENEAMSAMPSL
jgi:hypothetical protein